MYVRHDTWVREDVFKYLQSEKHRIYGNTKCNCKTERKRNKTYINPEIKETE